MLKDVQASAAALYDGGWRAGDKEELMAEYGLSEEEAESVCQYLEEFAKKERNEQ